MRFQLRRFAGLSPWMLVAIFTLASANRAGAALVEYWRFDDGSGDSAANTAGGNTGVLSPGSGAPAWISTGLHPPLTSRSFLPSTFALDFNAAGNNYVDGGNLGLVSNNASGAASVSLWLRPDSVGGDDRLFGQLSGAPSQAGAARTTSGALEVWSGGSWIPVASAGTLTAGSWQHLAFVWTNDSVQAYVNGVATGSGTSNFEYGGGNGNFGIGNKFTGLFGANFDGQIDDVSIWNHALSAAEVAGLAAGNSALAEPPPVVPEPAAWLLLSLAAGPFFRRRQTQRRR